MVCNYAMEVEFLSKILMIHGMISFILITMTNVFTRRQRTNWRRKFHKMWKTKLLLWQQKGLKNTLICSSWQRLVAEIIHGSNVLWKWIFIFRIRKGTRERYFWFLKFSNFSLISKGWKRQRRWQTSDSSFQMAMLDYWASLLKLI